jgi:hypothetical protein
MTTVNITTGFRRPNTQITIAWLARSRIVADIRLYSIAQEIVQLSRANHLRR